MDKVNGVWTIELVAQRFNEAAFTAQRLPPVRAQGYVSVWPAIVSQQWARQAGDRRRGGSPPSAAAIERMSETMRWVQWLEEEQRHLVWMRAEEYDWKDICKRFACNRTTAWRRWQRALWTVAAQLNNTAEGREGVSA